jgi:hypothetical protein
MQGGTHLLVSQAVIQLHNLVEHKPIPGVLEHGDHRHPRSPEHPRPPTLPSTLPTGGYRGQSRVVLQFLFFLILIQILMANDNSARSAPGTGSCIASRPLDFFDFVLDIRIY